MWSPGCSNGGYRIVFFTGEAVHDRWTVDDVRAALDRAGVTYAPEQIVDEPISTLDELLAQIARTDMVIASRFHGVLLSMVLHKPVIALSYHRKVDELMKDTGQGEYCLSIADFDVETVKQKFSALEPRRVEAAAQIAARENEYRQALDEQYERLFR